MIPRPGALTRLEVALGSSRVVALVGPRQCGKTTLARLLASRTAEATIFDFEDPAVAGALEQPMAALQPLRGLVVVDEVQRRPELFPVLRVLADREPPPSRFLLLGSASPDLLRFRTMLAHCHAQTWNAAELARSLGAGESTVRRYLYLLESLFLVRALQPWHANVGKRQVKAPRVLLRDSGLLHALLGLRSRLDVLSHPKCGASWEGFVVEQVLAAVRPDEADFRASHGGAEIDLVLRHHGRLFGVECRRTDSPRMTPSIRHALSDLGLEKVSIVYPGSRRRPSRIGSKRSSSSPSRRVLGGQVRFPLPTEDGPAMKRPFGAHVSSSRASRRISRRAPCNAAVPDPGAPARWRMASGRDGREQTKGRVLRLWYREGMATRSGPDESAVPGRLRASILKLDPAGETEDQELDFELDFQRSLTTAQRFELMFRRSREMVELLRAHGHGDTASIVKRA